jgi:PLP dependent protein
LSDLAAEWHFIGHMQRNKIRRTLPLTAMIHSLDSARLADAVDETAAELSIRVPALLEIHIAPDAAKGGFAPEEIESLLPALAMRQHLEIRGLMCMASLEGGLDAARRDFAALRNLRDRLQANCPESILLRELSMGMSGDYEIAIEEGATLVRVGSALFE